jgi:hypothetical protein
VAKTALVFLFPTTRFRAAGILKKKGSKASSMILRNTLVLTTEVDARIATSHQDMISIGQRNVAKLSEGLMHGVSSVADCEVGQRCSPIK